MSFDSHFLKQYFKSTSPIQLSPLAQEASTRNYYRVVNAGKTYMLMELTGSDKEKLKNSEYEWLEILDIFKKENIASPEVFFLFQQEGFILLEDLGPATIDCFINKKTDTQIKKLYFNVLPLLKKLNYIKTPGIWQKRSFDKALYEKELFFLKVHLKEAFAFEVETDLFSKEVKALSNYLEEKSNFFTHRDFHSRNILLQEEKLYLIDFQDARLGSKFYDLVSLCFDPYVSLSFSLRMDIFSKGIEEVTGKNPNNEYNEDNQMEWEAVFLQRTLKILGSYCYLFQEKKKLNYFQYIRPTIGFLNEMKLYSLGKEFPYLSQTLPKLLEKLLENLGL